MNTERDILEWIIDERQKEISPEEKSQLMDWVNESESNKKTYKRYNQLINKIDEIQNYQSIDKDADWQELNEKIKSRKFVVINWIGVAGVAAAIVFFNTFNNKSFGQSTTSYKESVRSGVIISSLKRKMVETIDFDEFTKLHNIGVKGAVLSQKAEKIIYEKNQVAEISEINTISIPRGKKVNVKLADGTELMINAESKVVYPTTFIGIERKIWLESGELFVGCSS